MSATRRTQVSDIQTIKELKGIAKELGIPRFSKLSKSDLIAGINSFKPPQTKAQPEAQPQPSVSDLSAIRRLPRVNLNMTIKRLKEIARERNMGGFSKMNKKELVETLNNPKSNALQRYVPESIPLAPNVKIGMANQWEDLCGESTCTTDLDNSNRIKYFKVTGNLNRDLTTNIMQKITPEVTMRTKVVVSFSSTIHRGQGETVIYHKTFASPEAFSSMSDIRTYIGTCESRRLDLSDNSTWSAAYLPPDSVDRSPGVYQGKVSFNYARVKLISSNEPLMGCGPLPEWLRSKKSIYSIDQDQDNLCVWRCLVIFTRLQKNADQPSKRTTEDALKLAREFYDDNNLKKKDVKPTKLSDFEKIADKFNVNIRLFETIQKNGQEIWQMVYGKNKFKESRESIDIGLYVDKSKEMSHCFYIKNLELLTTHWNCKGCGQRFERHGNYHRHVNEDRCTGGKTTVICKGEKFRKIMC